jgi:putative transposase
MLESPEMLESRGRSGKRKISLSHVFGGQLLGIREIEEKIWLLRFMHYNLVF